MTYARVRRLIQNPARENASYSKSSERDRERESLPDKHGRDVPVCVSEKVKKEEEDEGEK